jgi:diazepam-binding inhibitor (GABA receptor modulating acyl-CoA-binding protein)
MATEAAPAAAPAEAAPAAAPATPTLEEVRYRREAPRRHPQPWRPNCAPLTCLPRPSAAAYVRSLRRRRRRSTRARSARPQQFNAAYDSVRSWTRTNGDPNNDEKLAMYSLGKQAKVGDCNTDRPGMFDFAGKAKWDAWDAIKGKSKDDAMTEYIAELARQKTVYGEAPASG